MADFDTSALGDWLRTHLSGFEGPFSLTKFAEGQSNPTYRLDTPGGSYVLRRKPFGRLLPSAHAIDREFKLISALTPTGFPVPRAHGLCMDDSVIGAPFFVMSLVAGRNFVEGRLPSIGAESRRDVYFAMVDTLAALHRIEPAAVGLDNYGRAGNYFERQVARWTKQYRASQTDQVEEMERLIEWLPETVPQQSGTTIVHGDYRLDNLIFDEAEPEIRAVLDWELSTLGDPLADLSYFAMSWVMPPDGRAAIGGLDLQSLGIPALDEIVARYCARTGRESIPKLDWHFAYNLFRAAGITQGIKQRVLEGNASSSKAAAQAARLPEIAARAWTFAQRTQASG